MDQLQFKAEQNINASINPIKLQIGTELKDTLQGKVKEYIIDPKQVNNRVKACIIDPEIQNYIYEGLPIKKFPLSKTDELLVPKLKITQSLQKRFKEEQKQRTYTPNPKHLNNRHRKQEQGELENNTKSRSPQTIVINKISEFAFSDLLNDIIQDILKEKTKYPTIKSANIYKTNTFDDTQRSSDFMVLIEHKSGKQSCLAIDLTTAKDEYVLAKKNIIDTVSQTDFQSFLIDKNKHTFGNNKEEFNNKIAIYQNAKINRTVLSVDKNLFTYFLRDYITFIETKKGLTKTGDALKVFNNLSNNKTLNGNIKALISDITEYLANPTILN